MAAVQCLVDLQEGGFGGLASEVRRTVREEVQQGRQRDLLTVREEVRQGRQRRCGEELRRGEGSAAGHGLD